MAKTMPRRRAKGEAREIRDQEWLQLHRDGKSTSAIAERAGVSVQLVRRALARARERDDSRAQDSPVATTLPIRDGDSNADASPAKPPAPLWPWWLELVPMFPIGPYTPASECPHRGPLPKGSLICCMVCSASGMDGHPAMKRDPETDPRPEPKPKPEPSLESTTDDAGAETRRQRRARRFASRRVRDDDPSIPGPHTPR